MQNAWNKCNGSDFEFSIIEEVDIDVQFTREQEHLDRLQPFKDNAYNIRAKVLDHCEIAKEETNCCRCGIIFETQYWLTQKYCSACQKARQAEKDDEDLFFQHMADITTTEINMWLDVEDGELPIDAPY